MKKTFPDVKWHKCAVPKDEMKKIMQRSDAKGIVQTVLYFALLSGLGVLVCRTLGTGWVVPVFIVYASVYCFLNHMMHETIHRTPFKSRGLNDTVHWIATFLNGGEAVITRYTHLRHHKVTYYEEHDPELIFRRPTTVIKYFFKAFVDLPRPSAILRRATGRLDDQDRDLVPGSERRWLVWSSRLWTAAWILIILSCILFQTWLPLLLTIGARVVGAPLARLLDFSQHSCLEINVPDHRLCCRNIYLNPLLRFLYWNMNYHIEHHMFPAVPFHSLPKLHLLIRDQLPPASRGLFGAYREIVPALIRQQKDPNYYILPELPE